MKFEGLFAKYQFHFPDRAKQPPPINSPAGILASTANPIARPETEGRGATWQVTNLRPHPGYAQLGLNISSSRLNALLELGEDTFLFPLLVTSNGIVIDGYARLEVARLQGRRTESSGV